MRILPSLKPFVDTFCYYDCKWQGTLQCNKERCPLHDFYQKYGKEISKNSKEVRIFYEN